VAKRGRRRQLEGEAKGSSRQLKYVCRALFPPELRRGSIAACVSSELKFLWKSWAGYPGAQEGGRPVTNGRPGGKLPVGKLALRSPERSFSEASRKEAKNKW
jgi:hypothetical protein